ncbi:hypothetical protein Dimus_037337 [Dionaea muscipula]
MVKSSLPTDDEGEKLQPASVRARETKRQRLQSLRLSFRSASSPQPNPCPTGEEREKSGQPGESDSRFFDCPPFLSDSDILDCPICFDPLTFPVFECGNGHIACSSCCAKVENNCPTCGKKIGRNRNRAMEKVIELMMKYCGYADYGCKAVVSYAQIQEHQKSCIYAPCPCPFFGCLFRGCASKLSEHISLEHCDSVVKFSYNRLFPISLKWDTKSDNDKFIDKKKERFIVLQEENDGVKFFVERHEGTLNVRCVEACPDKGRFCYDLIVQNRSGSLRFRSSTKCVEPEMEDPLASDCLLGPVNFNASDVHIELCIWCKDASPPNINEGI